MQKKGALGTWVRKWANKKNLGWHELNTFDLWRSVFGEYLASTVFMLNPMFACRGDGELMGAAASTGFTVFMVICVFAPVSGAHINCAVTVGFFLNGSCPLLRSGLYWIAQLCGGVTGAAITRLTVLQLPVSEQDCGGIDLGPGISQEVALFLETFFTCFMMLQILNTVDERNGFTLPLGALTVGITVFVGLLLLVPVTGAVFNPVRFMGTAVFTGRWHLAWIYWTGPIVGCIIASFMYDVILRPPTNLPLTNEKAGKCSEDAAQLLLLTNHIPLNVSKEVVFELTNKKIEHTENTGDLTNHKIPTIATDDVCFHDDDFEKVDGAVKTSSVDLNNIGELDLKLSQAENDLSSNLIIATSQKSLNSKHEIDC